MSEFDWDFWGSKLNYGYSELALTGKKLLFHLCPKAFPYLEYDDEFIFTEPLIFSLASHENATNLLPSSILPHLSGDHSPVPIIAEPNELGVIVLPGIGYLIPNTLLIGPATIHYDSAIDAWSGSQGEKYISFQLLKEVKTNHHDFTLLAYKHPSINNFMRDVSNNNVSLAHEQIVSLLQKGSLEKALDILRVICPEFYSCMCCTTRSFLIFRAENINSFANETMQGICFLSIPQHVSTVYFADDVLHQCGHIMFSMMAFDKIALFLGNPDTPLCKWFDGVNDKRSIYVLCHAVFTEFLISTGLLRCIESNQLTEEEKDEAVGRLAFILQKYKRDLGFLLRWPELGKDGIKLREELFYSFKDIVLKSSDFVSDVNLKGQGYNFDYAT